VSRKISRKPKSPVVSKADYEHLAAFRNALREFLHFSEKAATAAGIPPQQHQAMLIIHGATGNDCLTVGELASHLKIKHHSAVGLVNRMEADCLIAKSQNSHDRRQVLVRLTARGRGVLEKLSATHKAELVRIGPALGKIFKHLKSIS